MIEFFFYAMAAMFFVHELDAVKRHEWRVMPVLSNCSDNVAEQIFIWTHAPLILLIIWFSGKGADTLLPLCLSMFAIVHVGLHWVYRKHPKNEFIGPGSWTIIVLTGIFGALHLHAYVVD